MKNTNHEDWMAYADMAIQQAPEPTDKPEFDRYLRATKWDSEAMQFEATFIRKKRKDKKGRALPPMYTMTFNRYKTPDGTAFYLINRGGEFFWQLELEAPANPQEKAYKLAKEKFDAIHEGALKQFTQEAYELAWNAWFGSKKALTGEQLEKQDRERSNWCEPDGSEYGGPLSGTLDWDRLNR